MGDDAVNLAKQLHAKNPVLYHTFGSFPSNMMSLVDRAGRSDLYDGVLRARDAKGRILDGVDVQTTGPDRRKKCGPGPT